ncbi:hypothetical protein [Azospirillum argentinense]|uniref:Uncharacterized protein n=1 Tax=Azospirillum argentinense TaxID=2970906 RepID=A0A5B0KKN0_9PROT|nr:hypothetical protein [Azospirillum argentinense]KAA1053217.1 hypothetical protein FH063_003136 [Azospirillum argentinense]
MAMQRRYLELGDVLARRLERFDARNNPRRNSAADRTSAEVMRRNGFTEAEIQERFGYIPSRYNQETEQAPRLGVPFSR